jgi:hypothetical protein
MTAPIPLPDWLPWWTPILLLAPALLYGLVFFFMPFSVLGVKGRLEAIEARLDEIQGEIRSLALRMPEPLPRSHFDEAYAAPPPHSSAYRSEPPLARPPIPPAPREIPEDGTTNIPINPAPSTLGGRSEGERKSARTSRAEPRLEWPR